jgi:hypothetical protein
LDGGEYNPPDPWVRTEEGDGATGDGNGTVIPTGDKNVRAVPKDGPTPTSSLLTSQITGVLVTVYCPHAVNTTDTSTTSPFRVTTRSTSPAVKRGATVQLGS